MSIKSLLNQTLTRYGKASYDGYGRPTLGSGTSIKARFQPKVKRVLAPNGDVIQIDAIAFVASDTTIETDDKVTYGNDAYKVFAKYAVPDGRGNTSHIELQLVKWQI